MENRFERRLVEETSKLHDETNKLRTELKVEMHSLRADIIRWMFIFWIGQLASMIAITKLL